jgi:hypothetical protein
LEIKEINKRRSRRLFFFVGIQLRSILIFILIAIHC